MVTLHNRPDSCPNASGTANTQLLPRRVLRRRRLHEWGHAYTEYTSGLIYQRQSARSDESYSDVWARPST